ncbi:phosphotransferase enzyme family protein [Paenibacillus eucommiae]|uniref:Ser/Thr protein kinase RdoA (MazF antagonist) n=1 Tax=Paenibacillus eucommiae TaxID=1355755 RepID=A0ABS4IRQ8_9BACL|nr:phosphotransferase [Paenibacillus eucommiae]MBP1989576.1 Ser/Thr protein kinase RdoA (MazF antagonist) [Paenibacillus eucommiae]
MNPSIKSLFTDKILAEAAKRYGLVPDELILLGNNQNFTYGSNNETRNFVIRIIHESHRSLELIQAELEWIQYLSNNDVPVSCPVESSNGKLIEEMNGFFVVAFQKALGAPWSDEISQIEEFEKLGAIAGSMHALTKKYIPSTGEIKRYDWQKNNYLRDFATNIPSSQDLVITHFESLMQKVHKLSRDSNSYGLIHGDFCFGNYTVQPNGRITVFDFDECQYGWFVQDISVNLFYGIAVPRPDGDVLTFVERYLTSFLKGYVKENAIDITLLRDLPLFLDMRQAILYSALYRNGNMDALDDWSQEFLKRARNNMENNLSLIEMDDILNLIT